MCYSFEFMFERGQTKSTQRKQRFKDDWDKCTKGVYSPLLGESDNEGERTNTNTPGGAPQI